jgi:hypothetical protein
VPGPPWEWAPEPRTGVRLLPAGGWRREVGLRSAGSERSRPVADESCWWPPERPRRVPAIGRADGLREVPPPRLELGRSGRSLLTGSIPFGSARLQKHRWGPPKWSPSRKMSGDVLLSHAVPRAVPSAQKGLASGFGMEPGVSLSPWSPKLYGDVVVQTTAPREPHSGRVAFVVKSSAY